MTRNQIAFRELLETRRHNLAAEQETGRSNRVQEHLKRQTNLEVARSNLANEAIKQSSLEETRRSNVAHETETQRSNLAKELETNRANIAKETETHRANVVGERETHRTNTAREEETKRSNLANEMIQNQKALAGVPGVGTAIAAANTAQSVIERMKGSSSSNIPQWKTQRKAGNPYNIIIPTS